MDATANGVHDGRVRGIHHCAHIRDIPHDHPHVRDDLRRNLHVLDRPRRGKLQPQGAREISASKTRRLFRLLKGKDRFILHEN